MCARFRFRNMNLSLVGHTWSPILSLLTKLRCACQLPLWSPQFGKGLMHLDAVFTHFSICEEGLSDALMIPSLFVGVFLSALAQFRVTLHSLNSDNPSDGNRQRHCECVPHSRRKLANHRQLHRLVSCRHARQGEDVSWNYSFSCVILSLKLVLCCNPRRFTGALVEQQ